MQTFTIHTLGCKLNFSESSTIGRQLQQHGLKLTDLDQKPDLVILNTCSVTDQADKKCRKFVEQVKKNHPSGRIVVIGCYAQLKPREIIAIPGVDAVLGAAEKFNLVHHLSQLRENENKILEVNSIDQPLEFHYSLSIQDRTRTFLKVQDGCNYNCAFCTIPLARGKSRSDSIANVLHRVRKLAAGDAPVKEIVLTGVNTGDFGIREGRRQERFIDLLKALDQVEGIDRYRISSIEPNLLSSDIIRFVAQSEKFVPHVHLPLQSGSDVMLKAMRRRYDTALYRDRVQEVLATMPDAAIGVDVITGFPGESEALFEETRAFLHELEVAYLHVFTYSERANTPAIEMKGKVPRNIRLQRSNRLRELSDKKRHFFNQRRMGSIYPVLFEHDTRDGLRFGYTPNYIRVGIHQDQVAPNTLAQVKLLETLPHHKMKGEWIKNYSNRNDSMGSMRAALLAG